jgi:hypothetical protein
MMKTLFSNLVHKDKINHNLFQMQLHNKFMIELKTNLIQEVPQNFLIMQIKFR